MSPVGGPGDEIKDLGVPDGDLGVPDRKEKRMRLPKRIAIALGSLLAIMLAGGAHYRL